MASFLDRILTMISGNSGLKVSKQLLYDKVIGFRGIVSGVGTSTVLQNVAIALSENTRYRVCVLDTNYLYPVSYPLLVNEADTDKRKDFLEYGEELSEVATKTKYRNLTLFSLCNRGIVDMMSSKDSDTTVERLIKSLKAHFDIILVDLSHELSNISAHFAVKCNRIINVADQSLRCIYNLRKSLNTMATLAVPFAKANVVVYNKVLADVNSNTKAALQDIGLNILAEIPFSKEIAVAGVSGRRLYASATSSNDIYAFSGAIDTLVDVITQKTPLNKIFAEKPDDSDEPVVTNTKQSDDLTWLEAEERKED